MKHTNPPKRLQDLNLMDRFLFCEAIENAEAYKIILEIALDREINLIGEPIAENEKRKELLGKIARLDVCAIGDDDRVYNAEVQKRYCAVKHQRFAPEGKAFCCPFCLAKQSLGQKGNASLQLTLFVAVRFA